jgi:hypothetical protein
MRKNPVVDSKHRAGTVSSITDRDHRRLMQRGLAALLIGALALTALRIGDQAFRPTAPHERAATSTVGRPHAPPTPTPVGVVGAFGVVLAALAWRRATVGRPGDIPARPASPIRRRGPPLLP